MTHEGGQVGGFVLSVVARTLQKLKTNKNFYTSSVLIELFMKVNFSLIVPGNKSSKSSSEKKLFS